MNPRAGVVFLILVGLFAGKPLSIGGYDVAPGTIRSAGRQEQEPGIRMGGVGVDHEASGIGSPCSFLAILDDAVYLEGPLLAQEA